MKYFFVPKCWGGANYRDLLKRGRVFLGHYFIINELEGFFPKNLQFNPPPPPPTITDKRVLRKGVESVLQS